MKLIIDRFEGDYAVCEKEDRTMLNINKVNLPDGAKEGDVIFFEDGKVVIDHSETKKRKSQVDQRLDKLWN